MKKRNLAVVLLATTLLVGCGTTNNGEAQDVQIETQTSQESGATATETPKEESTEKEINKVLYDNNGIKAVFTSFNQNGAYGPEIKLQLENTTEKNITVQVREVSINGYMMDPIFSEEVGTGKKANGSINFFESDLEENGIEQVNSIELSLHIFESDSYDTIDDSETIKIVINDVEETKKEVTGQILLDKDGLKVTYKDMVVDGDGEVSLKVFVENGLDTEATIQVRDCSVNGFMIDPICSIDVEPGKKANDKIGFMSWDLEEQGLEGVAFETVEFTLHVFNDNGTIMDVPATINLK
ncbi:MAG TPA: hypothetical protein DCW90_06370 [Lachnospiraceae bacterium]|nr:hypothetical protein [uncultured Lachnoclostridium sp.]HAU85123.1 hypothetical protein [Lachnospiraceae bacterium]